MRWIDILVFFWVGKQLKWYEMMFAMWNDVCDVNFKALLHSKNLVSWFVSGMKSLPYHTRHEMNQFRVLEFCFEFHRISPKLANFFVFWCYHCFDDTKNGRLCQDVEEEVEAKVWCLQLLIRLRRSNFFFPRRDPSNEEVPALTFQSLRVLTKLSLRGHRWFTTFDFFWGPGTCWSGALSRWYEENFQTPLKLNIVIKYCHVSHQLPFPTHHFGYPFFQKSTVHHWRF